MEISEGEGWRLLVDRQRSPYAALIGGQGWACELTGAELRALQEAIRRLKDQHRALAGELMAEEDLELDIELPLATPEGGAEGSLWLGLSGDRQRWSLRLVLSAGPGGRSVEGSWSVDASQAFAAALEPLRTSDADPVDQHC